MIECNNLKRIWYNNFNIVFLPIYYKLIVISIFYYICYLIKLYNPLWLIDNYSINVITFFNIILFIFRLIIAIIYYYNSKNIIDSLLNHFKFIYIIYCNSYYLLEEDDIDDKDQDSYDSYTSNSEYNQNQINILVPQNYNYSENMNTNHESNYRQEFVEEEKIKQKNIDIQTLMHIILFYNTYLFTICKNKHNNYIKFTSMKFKNLKNFDNLINQEIENLYYNFNINTSKFKLLCIEKDLHNFILTSYNNNHINIYNYNFLLTQLSKIQTNVNILYSYLDYDNIIYKLINYLSLFLIYINIFIFIIYTLNYLPNIGILYILILSYIYLYLDSIIYVLLNNFNNIDINNDKTYGINLDDHLHKLYDELYIMSYLDKKKTQFRYI